MIYLKNIRTGLFLKGYKGNVPLWTSNVQEIAAYSECDAKQLIQRLACQSQRVEAVASKNDKHR